MRPLIDTRQIKNTVRTAQALAINEKSDVAPLTMASTWLALGQALGNSGVDGKRGRRLVGQARLAFIEGRDDINRRAAEEWLQRRP